MSSGLLIVVSGPSGVGKTSLIKELLVRAEQRHPGELKMSVSHTTREPRQGEKNGTAYHFVSREEFARMVAAGEFLEHAEIYGDRYGTSKILVQQYLAAGNRVLLEIDWQGARQIRDSGIAQKSVFILPPSVEVLHGRLRRRNLDTPEVVKMRLTLAQNEMAHAREANHRVLNQDFEQAADELYDWCFAPRGGQAGT